MNKVEFSSSTRQNQINELAHKHEQNRPKHFDVVIVGGGIVGVGAARSAALRGLSVLLIEQNDFASGTSSKSSKLIHGGLRYLEMLDFGLVFESLSERHWLLTTHPHLVQPLEFILPHFKNDKRPKWLLGAGLWLYDTLSLFRTPFFHGRYSNQQLKSKCPGINETNLDGAHYYADAMMLDDELVLECAQSAASLGATLLNYVKCTKIESHFTSQEDRNNIEGSNIDKANFLVNLIDTKTQQDFSVTAQESIICVGPWTHRMHDIITGGSGKNMKPSKGVHLVIPWQRLPVESCVVMAAPDGRIIFAIPRKDFGPGAEVVIIGTTDSPESQDPSQTKTTNADAKYLLDLVSHYFPNNNICEKDIIATYAGVRPLLDDGAATEAKTSREHEIWRNDQGVVFMAGGKYTTFRAISEEIIDFAFPHTKENINPSFEILSSPEDYKMRFSGDVIAGKYTEGWIRWKLHNHCPTNLIDVIFRRTPLWMLGSTLSQSAIERVAAICADYWRWTPKETSAQIESCTLALRDSARLTD